MENLPWNFEAFRRFLSYEVMQQAAATLCLFEGKPIFFDEQLMVEFSDILDKRTGLEWLPRRTASEGVLFNIEGNLFRNKARVFTSFYLVDPECLKVKGNLIITNLCSALGFGFIKERQFYKEIFARYEYPHPAYDENWKMWNEKGCSIKPLAFFLKIMLEIFKLDGAGEVSAGELARFAHPRPIFTEAPGIAREIVQSRKRQLPSRKRSDKIDRKITDILGFMCVSKFCFYYKQKVKINLFSIQKEEKTAFWESRLNHSALDEIEKFLDSI